MEVPIDCIKAEPRHDEFHPIPVEDIKLEIKTEAEVIEVDESIFLQGPSDPSKGIEKSNTSDTFGDDIIYDEIIKEEPIFYDPYETETIDDTIDVIEPEWEEKYVCDICGCETGSVGLLKWHIKERHPQEQQKQQDQQLKEKNRWDHSYTKDYKLPQKKKRMCQKEKSVSIKRLMKPTKEDDVIEVAKKNVMGKDDEEKKKIYGNGVKTKTNSPKPPIKTASKQTGDLQESQKQTNKSSDETFECTYCWRKFDSSNRLDSHLRIHTNQKPYQCSVCHKFYNNSTSFAVHMRIHTGEKPYECTHRDCDMKFRLKPELFRHLKAHIDGTPLRKVRNSGVKIVENIAQEEVSNFQLYECYLCPFHGPKNQVRIHMKEEHIGETLHKCDICSKKFLLERSVESHMMITHNKTNQFECHICGKMLARKDALSIHIQYHTGDFPYECKYCPKRFSKIYTLKTHVRTHAGFKPFTCEVCQKGFVKRSDLVRHSRTHSGERPFKCDICNSSFTRFYLMRDHKQNVHKIRTD